MLPADKGEEQGGTANLLVGVEIVTTTLGNSVTQQSHRCIDTLECEPSHRGFHSPIFRDKDCVVCSLGQPGTWNHLTPEFWDNKYEVCRMFSWHFFKS